MNKSNLIQPGRRCAFLTHTHFVAPDCVWKWLVHDSFAPSLSCHTRALAASHI